VCSDSISRLGEVTRTERIDLKRALYLGLTRINAGKCRRMDDHIRLDSPHKSVNIVTITNIKLCVGRADDVHRVARRSIGIASGEFGDNLSPHLTRRSGNEDPHRLTA
jgi:hypothetical protein